MTDWERKTTTLEDMLIVEEEENLPEVFMDYSLPTEPFHGFSRIGDNSGQWFRLFQALEKQDVPGWPFMTPMLVRMQKCQTCAREFFSGINYRRHLVMHEQSEIYAKETQRKRSELEVFWSTLSSEDVKEVLSFQDVTPQGDMLGRSLTLLVRSAGFSVLPQLCVKAGSALSDIIHGRESRFPKSAFELFRIFDAASERTFLCGTASILKKTVFDPEIGRSSRSGSKNLVATVSFLLEMKVVRAWCDGKKVKTPKIPKAPKKPKQKERSLPELSRPVHTQSRGPSTKR